MNGAAQCKSFVLSVSITLFVCCVLAAEPTREKVALREEITLYRSGLTNCVVQFMSNKLVSAKCYKPSGELASEVVNGNGVWSAYHENGTNETLCTYVDGEKHGRMIAWREDGTKKYERDYKSGKRDGVWIDYFSNEQKRSEVVYKDNQEIRKSVWGKDGKKQLDIDYSKK